MGGGGPDDLASCDGRLDEAVAEYLIEAEAGRPPDRSRFLAQYADLADDLAAFLDDRARIGRVLAGVSGPARRRSRPAAAACPHCHAPVRLGSDPGACPGCGVRFRLDRDDPRPADCKLGRFELTAVAGRGAFGTVYKAWDPDLSRAVAVKVPRRGAFLTPEDVERFLREARFAVGLHHPNIVQVYEVGRDGDVPYLVGEFVPGTTLADQLADHRPAPDRAAELVGAVADALDCAHRHGVVHRDVKPSNILLRWGEAPLLADFGLARQVGGEPTLTLDGDVLGTPAYMSPEQARGGAHRVDGRADVYSLGVVLYQCLTGLQPFVGSPRMVLHQILHDDPRPPRALNDRLPADLETICLKCLRKDPDHRYRTAAELADDLRRFRLGRPISARPEGRRERLARWVRRNPALAATAAAAAVLLGTTAAVAAGWAVHAEGQSAEIRRALDASRRVTAETQLDRGLAEGERGDVAQAVHWIARSLESAPAGADDLTWAARTNFTAWGRKLCPLTSCAEPPPGRVLGFDADGRHGWVLAPDSHSVRKWDLISGRPVGKILDHPDPVAVLAVSRDGRRVATASASARRSVRVWNAETGVESARFEATGEVRGLAFLPGGQGLVTAEVESGKDTAPGGPGTVVRARDVTTGRAAGEGFRHPDHVGAMAIDPDGTWVFVADRLRKTVYRYEFATGRRSDWALAHPVPVRVLAVGPGGRQLLTAGPDREVRLWGCDSGRLAAVLHHREPAAAVGFGPDGRTLLTASPGDAVRVWGKPDPGLVEVATLPRRAGVWAMAVSPTGNLIATGSDDRLVRVWDAGAGALAVRHVLPEEPNPVKFVGFSPDGRLLGLSAFARPGARVWDTGMGRELPALAHPAQVHTVAFSPDGRRAATVAYADPVVRVWDLTDRAEGRGEPVALWHGRDVLAVAFSPDGRTLLTGCNDGVARRWDLATGTVTEPVMTHGGKIEVAAYSPDGSLVMTAGGLTARLWRAETGAPVGLVLIHGDEVRKAAFGNGGRTVMTGVRDSSVWMWDPATGAPRGQFTPRHADAISVVAVAPTGRWAVSGSDDGTARVWDAEVGRPIGPPLAHDDKVKCAVVDPAGRWVVTGGLDGTVRRWPAPAPAAGPAARLAAWAAVATGTELDATGALRVLDPAGWAEAHRRLADHGGPPPTDWKSD